MTDALKLLPLPEPTIEGSVMHPELKICYRTLVHFTAEQMQAYVLADRAQRQVSDAERLDAARYRWLRMQPFDVWKKIGWNLHPEQENAEWIAECRDRETDAIRSQQSQAGEEGGRPWLNESPPNARRANTFGRTASRTANMTGGAARLASLPRQSSIIASSTTDISQRTPHEPINEAARGAEHDTHRTGSDQAK